MPDKLSGCGCCTTTTCENASIAFTPTAERDRISRPSWKPFTEYLAGDEFHQQSNNDGAVYLYRVDFTLFSGGGWTVFEESRYTQVRRVDLFDEVKEWDLFGSGWGLLEQEEISEFLANGRLAEGMGYVSKSEVLPSIESWRVDFNYFLSSRAFKQTQMSSFAFEGATTIEVSNPQLFSNYPLPTPIRIGSAFNIATAVNGSTVSIQYPLTDFITNAGTAVILEAGGRNGLRLQMLAQVSVDQVGNPNSYYMAESEWMDALSDPPGMTLFDRDRPRVISRERLKRVFQNNQTDLDTFYEGIAKPTTMRRGTDVFGANLVRVDIGTIQGFDTLHLLVEDIFDDLNKAFMVSATGMIALPDGEIPVETGDVLVFRQFPKTNPSGWELIKSDDLAFVDILQSSQGSVETPDPDNEISGRKVAIYVSNGQEAMEGLSQEQSWDVDQFTGVTVSRTRTPSLFECEAVATFGSCNQDEEFDLPPPYFLEGIGNLEAIINSAGDSWLDIGVPFTTDYFGEITDQRYAVNLRFGVTQYAIAKAVAKVWTYQQNFHTRQRIVILQQFANVELDSKRGFHTHFLIEQQSFLMQAISFTAWIGSKPFFSELPVINFQITPSTIPTFDGWISDFGQSSEPLLLAYTSGFSTLTRDFNCMDFQATGPWLTDDIGPHLFAPQPNYPPSPMTWTIKNA